MYIANNGMIKVFPVFTLLWSVPKRWLCNSERAGRFTLCFAFMPTSRHISDALSPAGTLCPTPTGSPLLLIHTWSPSCLVEISEPRRQRVQCSPSPKDAPTSWSGGWGTTTFPLHKGGACQETSDIPKQILLSMFFICGTPCYQTW